MVQVWLSDEMLPRVLFATTRAISSGQEILIDYSDAHWKPRDASATSPLVIEDFLTAKELIELTGDGHEEHIALGSQLATRLSSVLGVEIDAGTEVERAVQRDNGISTKHVDKNPDGSSPRA